jgi:CRISPR system Cascade subunit CasD
VAAFLTFALVAPLASFGAIAVGERRPTWDRPARSAVLGLVGACLGVEREDDAGQAALAGDYGVALLCHAPGRLLADYHTAQVPPARGKRRFATRAQELAAPDLSTILSRRDYRTGAWHLGALWVRGQAPCWPLEAIVTAMRTPGFVPYLGRKSCPLGLPLHPLLDDAPDPGTALARRHRSGPEARFRHRVDTAGEAVVARDHWGEPSAALRVELRRDQPRSRRLWQFDLREEVVERLPALDGNAA